MLWANWKRASAVDAVRFTALVAFSHLIYFSVFKRVGIYCLTMLHTIFSTQKRAIIMHFIEYLLWQRQNKQGSFEEKPIVSLALLQFLNLQWYDSQNKYINKKNLGSLSLKKYMESLSQPKVIWSVLTSMTVELSNQTSHILLFYGFKIESFWKPCRAGDVPNYVCF